MGGIEKPHAVCIPYPAQGHINPMLKLAKLLHHRGFHITFVNTEHNHRRLLKSRGPHSLDGISSFRFESIPDGLPPSEKVDATQDIHSLMDSITNKGLGPFRDLLLKLNRDADLSGGVLPPVSCVVCDGIMTFTVAVTEELEIPQVVFWTASACGFMGYDQYPQLIERNLMPTKDPKDMPSGYMDTVLDWIPSMEGIRLKDLPVSITIDEFSINFVITETKRAKRASAIIFNTFEQLEHGILDALSLKFPPIYTIGPLQFLHNQLVDNDMKMIGSNLWKEDSECLLWLDSKEPNSVVYVNLGSMVVITPTQLEELSWGLANSDQNFLWIMRPDLVGGESAVLSPEFLAKIKKRGMLVNWCPQEKVLEHPSIGGFLTHSGWNSTLESISSGVPMICWPCLGDQQLNCWYCCNKWGIGMEIDGDVARDKVEGLVRELVVGEKGKEMKKNAMNWKRKAEEATSSSSGSSYMNFENMINQVLLSPKH